MRNHLKWLLHKSIYRDENGIYKNKKIKSPSCSSQEENVINILKDIKITVHNIKNSV